VRIFALVLALLVGCAASPVTTEPTSTAPAKPRAPAEGARPLLVTVDDLPLIPGVYDPAERRAVTRALLEVLARYDVKAVGLVTWSRMIDAEETALLEEWLEAGHELGNHSATHPSFTGVDFEAFEADVEAARERLAKLLAPRGTTVRFFRFPFLREGDTPEKFAAMRRYLAGSGQQNLPVTLDTQDWAFEEPWLAAPDDATRATVAAHYQASLRSDIIAQEALGDRLTGRAPAQILVLHASRVSAAQWPALFDWLLATGHRFARADEVLADPIYADLPTYIGDYGPGLFDRMAAIERRGRIERELAELLSVQAGAWTRGDLEAFCAVYADDAVFVSPSGVTAGRGEVLERYRKRYGDAPATMGALSLEIRDLRLAEGEEFTRSGAARPTRVHAASVVARWTLRWPDQPEKTGHTLIVFHRRASGWEIVQDASM
jgi:peptidoglycan-N-acetylglucosamine deacetylase